MNVTRALSILGFVGLVSLNACHLSKEEYTKIDAWLLCDDCANGERAAVKAIGGKAVHTLDRALIGPSPGRRANMEAQFRQAYRTLPGAPTVPESAYVAELRDNYVALYQRRAAISLADIGDSRALAALRRAQVQVVTRGYRSDVVRVINALLGARDFPSFTGVIRPRAAGWGRSVVVIRDMSGPAWDMNERVALYHATTSDTLIVSRWPAVSDSFSFYALAQPGQYALLITGLGPPADTQVTSFTVTSGPHITHTPTNAPTVTTAAFPQTVQVAMGYGTGDTTDYFRFQPSAELRVTAFASAGTDAPSLRWYECPPVSLAPLGPPGVLTGHVVQETGAPLAGAEVVIPGSALTAVTNGAGRFSLAPIPPVFRPGGLVRVRVSRIGYLLHEQEVQAGADSVVLSLAAASSDLRHHGSSVRIAPGSCRFLELAIPSSDPHGRVVMLRLTSP